jgi:hypothetical protein
MTLSRSFAKPSKPRKANKMSATDGLLEMIADLKSKLSAAEWARDTALAAMEDRAERLKDVAIERDRYKSALETYYNPQNWYRRMIDGGWDWVNSTLPRSIAGDALGIRCSECDGKGVVNYEPHWGIEGMGRCRKCSSSATPKLELRCNPQFFSDECAELPNCKAGND